MNITITFHYPTTITETVVILKFTLKYIEQQPEKNKQTNITLPRVYGRRENAEVTRAIS